MLRFASIELRQIDHDYAQWFRSAVVYRVKLDINFAFGLSAQIHSDADSRKMGARRKHDADVRVLRGQRPRLRLDCG